METKGHPRESGDERNVNAAVATIESLTDAEQAEVILRMVAMTPEAHGGRSN